MRLGFLFYLLKNGKIKRTAIAVLKLCWHQLIFPGRLQPSIFSTSELNCRVRDGNGCTLTVINTNYVRLIGRKIDNNTNKTKMQVFF